MFRSMLSSLVVLVFTLPLLGADSATWFACRVVVDHGNGTTAHGSGTPVWSEGGKTTILTNSHVVPAADKDRPISIMVDGKTYPARYLEGSQVLDTGPNSIKVLGPDLALLEIDVEIGYVELADSVPPVDSQVWQFGFGGVRPGQGPTTKSGFVSNSNHYVDPILTSTIASVNGDSGSGIFNTAGELCGVTWGGSRGECFAVEIVTVRQFLGRKLLAKLFPKLMARLAVRRNALKLPAPSKIPPIVVCVGVVGSPLVVKLKTYDEAHAKVLNGYVVTLYVGVLAGKNSGYYVVLPSGTRGIADGEWRCSLVDGVASMVKQ